MLRRWRRRNSPDLTLPSYGLDELDLKLVRHLSDDATLAQGGFFIEAGANDRASAH
jgi:hypothetical protein